MRLRDMFGYAAEIFFKCEIYDYDNEEIIYEGLASELPGHYLDTQIVSWDLEDDVIIFNVRFNPIHILL